MAPIDDSGSVVWTSYSVLHFMLTDWTLFASWLKFYLFTKHVKVKRVMCALCGHTHTPLRFVTVMYEMLTFNIGRDFSGDTRSDCFNGAWNVRKGVELHDSDQRASIWHDDTATKGAQPSVFVSVAVYTGCEFGFGAFLASQIRFFLLIIEIILYFSIVNNVLSTKKYASWYDMITDVALSLTNDGIDWTAVLWNTLPVAVSWTPSHHKKGRLIQNSELLLVHVRSTITARYHARTGCIQF